MLNLKNNENLQQKKTKIKIKFQKMRVTFLNRIPGFKNYQPSVTDIHISYSQVIKRRREDPPKPRVSSGKKMTVKQMYFIRENFLIILELLLNKNPSPKRKYLLILFKYFIKNKFFSSI